jgi:tetratricopeptide (TPR) repeat protein
MSTISDALAQAQQFEQAGYLGPAEQLYRRVLHADSASGEAFLLLGNNLFRQGRLAEAIDKYKDSIRLQPDSGGTYLNLSDALSRLGNLEAAADYLRQCLLRLPQFPEAHYNLGNMLGRMGRLEQAVAQFQEALRVRPDYAEAHSNLASTFLSLGKVDEAVAHLEAAIRLWPNYADAHYNLGYAYRERNQFAEAIQAYERAVAFQPDHGPAHNGLGQIFMEQGEIDKGEFHLRRALDNNPFMIRALFNLANYGLYSAADPNADTLKQWLSDPRLSVDSASQLHFILGKLLDRAGAFDEAFEHFRQGNALRRSLLQKSGRAFDPVAHSRRIDELIATFSADYFQRVQGFGADSELPVFIVGMPRSGTTLVEQILSHHPKVYGGGELNYLDRLVAALSARLNGGASYPACLTRLDSATARELAATHLEHLRQLSSKTCDSRTTRHSIERVTDKMLQTYAHLGIIATLFPHARVICCRRDPRDVCLSCFFHFFKGLSFTWDLADLGRYYRDYERLMAHWRAVLPLPILEVVYEDLVANQESVSRRLVDFCGLEWDDRCLQFHENPRPIKTPSVLQVRQPIYQSSVGRWQRYAAHLSPLFQALGYSEEGEGWVESSELIAFNKPTERQWVSKTPPTLPPYNVQTTEALAQAQQLEQGGDLGRAEELYRRITQADPANADVFFLLGNNLFRQGNLAEAGDQFRHSIRLSPDSGGAYLNLADALRRQGNLQGAVDCLRQCLLRLPEFPEAHYTLGNALQSLGRLEESATHYHHSLRLLPDFAEAHRNLANTFLQLGKVDEAAEHLEQAVLLRPNYLEAHCGLGTAYRARSQFAEAIHCYQQALELKPDYGPAHNGLGEAYLELGDAERAELHLRRALHNNPSIIRTLLNLASHGFYTAADPSVDTLKSWLSDPRLTEDSASQLHFTLGTLLDRAGSPGEAFAHFRQGNILRRTLFQKNGSAFDPLRHSQWIDRLIAAFSPEYFRQVHGFGLDTEVPVFIVGMPRSGTTLVEQILSHHPTVFGAGELTYLDQIAAELPRRLGTAEGYPECLGCLDPATVKEIATAHLHRLTIIGSKKATVSADVDRVSDKMPLNFLHLGIIATLFPRAHVICCRRDPRDVCVSCFCQFFNRFNVSVDLVDLGRYYRDYERLMSHWRLVLPLPILDVVYEDLVADQESVSRQLVDFCGLAWDERCLRFQENPRPVKTASVRQVRRPIYTSSVGRWRRYSPHMGPLFQALGYPEEAASELNKQL